MSLELRDQLKKRYGSPTAYPCSCGGFTTRQGGQCPGCATPSTPVESVARAMAFQSEKGRTVITAPAREVALKNDGFMYLHGRFVEADKPNGNGALWTTDDLQLGAQTVTGGPLNWLHDDRKIIGTLLSGDLIYRSKESASVGNHIASTAAVWRFLFPNEAKTIERAADEGALFYSMECVSRQVACVGDNGCGEEFSYGDYDAGQVCSHLREKSSIRRFVDPIFLGGAVIVPPVKPGWADASAEVIRQAAQLTEEHDLKVDREAAQAMTAKILEWANR